MTQQTKAPGGVRQQPEQAQQVAPETHPGDVAGTTASATTSQSRLPLLVVGALGVVYGDIGTSPLYALRECFKHGLAVDSANILGVLSLIAWSLLVVISLKYLVFVLRFDNRGEGGILALMALVVHRPGVPVPPGRKLALLALGLFGAALLYGDGILTPAISVLAAVEGLNEATTAFENWIVPITIGLLCALFFIQRRGTTGIGRIFGPVVFGWFVALGLLGLSWILRAPEVLWALSPSHAGRFFALHGFASFAVLGAVFLVVTGGEALYADMGHFGRRPIRLAWWLVVLPALLLNYFGQGALLLLDPSAAENPFYRMVPAFLMYPMVALATAATVIASQSGISGAFSLTHQAVRLGYLPRMRIIHTSADEPGQVYVPAVNWFLLASVIVLVIGFGSATAIAGAYGIAVIATMIITTLLGYVAAREIWGIPKPQALRWAGFFLAIDIGFLIANAAKVRDGGWVPLLVAAIFFVIMATWKRGQDAVRARLIEESRSAEDVLLEASATTGAHRAVRVPGEAVYLTAEPAVAPYALVHNLEANHALHDRVVLVTVVTTDAPEVADDARVEVTEIVPGAWRVIARYGFLQSPDVPRVLAQARAKGLPHDPAETTYFLARQELIPSSRRRGGMPFWQKLLFVTIWKNAHGAGEYFKLPASRVVELGTRLKL